MLLPQKAVLEILRCPISGSRLKMVDNQLVAASVEEKNEYQIIDGYPVLIDFASSVLARDRISALSSVIERRSYSGLTGIAKRIVSPPNLITAQNLEHVRRLILTSKSVARVLVIGGATIGDGLEAFYRDPSIELVSFDICASPNVQFLADAHSIPLPDESFDAVIIQAVLEHVVDPAVVVIEIHRVLKSNGVVYADTPFLQHVHEGAYDFTRFTESGHRYLFKNFELVSSGASAGAGTQLLWSLDNFFRGLFRSRSFGKLIKLFFFWLRYCDKVIPDTYNIDAASGVFFLGRKTETRIDVKEIVAHYKGAQAYWNGPTLP